MFSKSKQTLNCNNNNVAVSKSLNLDSMTTSHQLDFQNLVLDLNLESLCLGASNLEVKMDVSDMFIMTENFCLG